MKFLPKERDELVSPVLAREGDTITLLCNGEKIMNQKITKNIVLTSKGLEVFLEYES